MASAEAAAPRPGRVFVSPLAAYYDLPGDLGFENGEAGPGIGVGFSFGDRWAGELAYFHFDGKVSAAAGNDDGQADTFWANALWLVPVQTPWQPYATLGVGRSSYDLGAGGDDDQTEVNFGVGAFVALDRRIYLRGDARGVYLTGAGEVKPFLSLGLSVTLGRLESVPPPDADGDGVADPHDACPDTPPGQRVDVTGCEFDGDGDGVVDGSDACPGTPSGAAVDGRGCALDGDVDGVPDYLDACPDTELGARVDARGCYVVLEKTVTIQLKVEFASDSATLGPAYAEQLREVISFLREYPRSFAIIEGHTDDTGAASYNQQLSERRALAVLEALVAGGVDPDRLSAVGYGEARPVASNETPAGRQQNRRVDAVISGSRPVRQ